MRRTHLPRRPWKDPEIPENTQQPRWEQRPDGTRERLVNGIRIVDRTGAGDRPPRRPEAPPVEHLVTWQEDGGRVIVLGLDADCKPVSTTTLYDYR